jgi:hypothetical protein
VASGVLYHQAEPLQLLRALAERANMVFLWSHYYQEGLDCERIKSREFTRVPGVCLQGFQCDLFRLQYGSYLRDGRYRGVVDSYAHWMKRDDVLAALRHFGLTEIDIPFEDTLHPFGAHFTVLARRAARP